MIDLNASELNRLYEGSKDDHYIVVGSEIRQMIGMIRRRDERIAGLEADPLHGHAYASEVREALELAEDVLSRSPFSTDIWPNGMHPNTGITKIRAAIKALSLPSTEGK